jgi:hypothetical protein
MNLLSIVKGWYSYLHGDPAGRVLLEKRAPVCDACPHKRQLSTLGKWILKGVNENSNTFYCGLCGCPLEGKLREMSAECPEKRWLSEEPKQSYY